MESIKITEFHIISRFGAIWRAGALQNLLNFATFMYVFSSGPDGTARNPPDHYKSRFDKNYAKITKI